MMRAAIAGAVLCVATSASAGAPDFRECAEAGEFVRNAALGRDAGMTRQAFIDRMLADFVLVRGFPVALRWFVKDASDERFLLAAATEVFDAPRRPAEHEASFLVACAERSLPTVDVRLDQTDRAGD